MSARADAGRKWSWEPGVYVLGKAMPMYGTQRFRTKMEAFAAAVMWRLEYPKALYTTVRRVAEPPTHRWDYGLRQAVDLPEEA